MNISRFLSFVCLALTSISIGYVQTEYGYISFFFMLWLTYLIKSIVEIQGKSK